jgi:cellulose synthase/poly-beta-1,6-N-acetylglucosamine synthase-like glycosyltransferase
MRGDQLAQDACAASPQVSVVIPVAHATAFLADQIRAVLGQDAPFAYEVVIACNATTADQCAQLRAMADAERDRRLHVVHAHDRHSAAFARNAGASVSTGAVLAFCDSDDLVSSRWLVELVRDVSDDVAVGGHLDERRFTVPSQAGWRPPITPGTLPTFLGVPYAVSANFAVARGPFRSVGGFDTSLTRCEDIALSWRLRDVGVELRFASDAVVHYRHRTGVRALVGQHYRYGVGMAQVLHRYGVPHDGPDEPGRLAEMRPNGQPMDHHSFVGSVVRRGSLAAGRVVGLAGEWRTARPGHR